MPSRDADHGDGFEGLVRVAAIVTGARAAVLRVPGRTVHWPAETEYTCPVAAAWCERFLDEGGAERLVPPPRKAPSPARHCGGVALRSESGEPLGELCLVSDSAHELDATERAVLDTTARELAVVLEHHPSSWRCNMPDSKHEHLLEVVDSTPSFVALVGRHGRLVFLNRAGRELLGATVPVGGNGPAHCADVLPARTWRGLRERALPSVLQDGRYCAEDTLVAADGTEVPVRLTAVAHGDDYVSLVAEDLRPARAAEEERRAHAAANSASAAKGRLLADVSHELRTPLHAIRGFAQVLALGDLEEEDTEAVQHILDASSHLLALVDDLLDGTLIENGGLRLTLGETEVALVVGESLSFVAQMAADRHVDLHVTSHPSCDCRVLADRRRLRQVLVNSLSNAVKYNHPGGSATVTCHGHTDDGTVRITIEDTGAGIAPDAARRMFTRFDRLGAESSGVEGTGLGLAISHQLLEAMGGRLAVQSASGSGTTVTIALPVVPAP